jgi:hypothetical protein
VNEHEPAQGPHEHTGHKGPPPPKRPPVKAPAKPQHAHALTATDWHDLFKQLDQLIDDGHPDGVRKMELVRHGPQSWTVTTSD